MALTVSLHPYQELAVDKGVERGNLLIAYEQGLGKTVIAFAIIEDLIGQDKVSTTVVVVPASLKYQWAEQAAKLTDMETREVTLKVDGEKQTLRLPQEQHLIVIDGDKKKREALYAKAKSLGTEYIVMGYENVVNDWNFVRRIKQDATILDEATAIKTFKAARTKKVKRLTSEYRYALTGTPVENGKPEEIYSIMQWVDPEVLGRFDLFDKAYIVRNGFGGVKRYKNLPVLHTRLAQAMVRKTRQDEDVKPYLPEVQESTVEVTLDPATKKAYSVIAADLQRELAGVQPGGSFDVFAHYHGGGGGDDKSAAGRVMARMGALDMLLDHPDLLILSAQQYEESMRRKLAGEERANWPGSKYAYDLWQRGVLDNVTGSPKLDALWPVLENVLGVPGNKVILFSRFPDMLEYIADRFDAGTYVLYHGGMNAAEKAVAKVKFTEDPGCRLFLSSHAGAYGTDLWMANYLINFDLAWSSGLQDQINKRHDRASSLFNNIYILNMIVKGSVEVRKYQSLALKRKVGSAILDNRGADDKGRVVNDLATLTEFLRTTTI